MVASHRQDRTFHPPAGYCPLCPTEAGGFPTEIPEPDYQIVVFDNKFPALDADTGGACEVICYTSDHEASLGSLPSDRARLLARAWKDRFCALRSRPDVKHVFIFENRGREIGVTLDHPHGQIYAYPFIPPQVQREREAEQAHWNEHGVALQTSWLKQAEERSVVAERDGWVLICPDFARFPYELWVVPRSPLVNLAQMDDSDLDGLAAALPLAARLLDSVFDGPMPYLMAMRQPTMDGEPGSLFRVEFLPFRRAEGKLKYLAGSETGAGAFVTDVLPETAAERLRELNRL